MSRLRVGFDVAKGLGPIDGIGRYIRQLAESLAELRDPGLELSWLGVGQALDLGAARAAFGERFEPRPLDRLDGLDVVHATTWTMPPSFTGPVVFTVYDLTFLTHGQFHTVENKSFCLDGTLDAIVQDATFVAISRHTADELCSELDVSRDQIRVVYPAPAAFFRPLEQALARRRVAERFGLDGPFVLTVGTLEPRKNLRRLIDGWAAMPDAVRDGHPLVVVGRKGWLVDDLDLGRAGAGIVQLGPVPDEDLVALYNAATVFAYPSIAEGFGLPVTEAMACGTAVVTSRDSVLPEIAGDAAILVDPLDPRAIGEGLEALLGDDGKRRELAEAGRGRAARFTWERTARETVDVYRGAVEDAR